MVRAGKEASFVHVIWNTYLLIHGKTVKEMEKMYALVKEIDNL